MRMNGNSDTKCLGLDARRLRFAIGVDITAPVGFPIATSVTFHLSSLTAKDSMLHFSVQEAQLSSSEIWESKRPLGDAPAIATESEIAGRTKAALASPLDFPALSDAVVPGDRVALAVDPNVPSIDKVVAGVLSAIRNTEAGEIDVVLWDEANSQTIDSIKAAAPGCQVVIHQCDSRAELSYLAADAAADPIYLNRHLVEADLVLPIIAVRSGDQSESDVTGIFPMLTDSATRHRAIKQCIDGEPARQMQTGNRIDKEIPWVLGVQLVCAVRVNDEGHFHDVIAGTIESIERQVAQIAPPTQADLVIASLDGNPQQQTWDNVLRALRTATRIADSDATIVLWTELSTAPDGLLLAIDQDSFDEESAQAESDEAAGLDQDGLPTWNRFGAYARLIRPLLRNHRVLLYSRLDSEDVERMGIGVIDSVSQLATLSRGFSSCGIVRSAGYTV